MQKGREQLIDLANAVCDSAGVARWAARIVTALRDAEQKFFAEDDLTPAPR